MANTVAFPAILDKFNMVSWLLRPIAGAQLISIFTANLTCLKDAETLGQIFLAVSFLAADVGWAVASKTWASWTWHMQSCQCPWCNKKKEQEYGYGCPFGSDNK